MEARRLQANINWYRGDSMVCLKLPEAELSFLAATEFLVFLGILCCLLC